MRGFCRFSFRAASLVLLLVMTVISVRSQTPEGPLPPKPGAKTEAAPSTPPQSTIRVRVNEVTAPVTVRDRKGELVLDLSEGDFRIYDNGKEQTIDHFDLGGDPLSIALVVETSSRIQPLLPAIRATGIIFTDTVMAATGEAAVIGCNDTVDLLQPFTADQDAVEKTIHNLSAGTAGLRLYDGMSRAESMLEREPSGRRRVMLVMAQAEDTGSETKLGEVLRQAQLTNISIYTIALSTTAAELRASKQYSSPKMGPDGTYPVPLPAGTPDTPTNEDRMAGNVDLLNLGKLLVQRASNEVKHQALQVAASSTGGLYLRTYKDVTMQKVMDDMGGELHAQYTLSYKPTSNEPSGFHDITVVVARPDVKVRTRPGYYLAPPGS